MSEEPDRALNWICTSCGEFFDKRKVDSAYCELALVEDKVVEEISCPNDCDALLEDCGNHGVRTPWEEWRVQQLLDEIRGLDRKISEIDDELENYNYVR